ncbi:MAG: hypothetical protein U0169_13645 [Polyangiaceae bacterium]
MGESTLPSDLRDSRSLGEWTQRAKRVDVVAAGDDMIEELERTLDEGPPFHCPPEHALFVRESAATLLGKIAITKAPGWRRRWLARTFRTLTNGPRAEVRSAWAKNLAFVDLDDGLRTRVARMLDRETDPRAVRHLHALIDPTLDHASDAELLGMTSGADPTSRKVVYALLERSASFGVLSELRKRIPHETHPGALVVLTESVRSLERELEDDADDG